MGGARQKHGTPRATPPRHARLDCHARMQSQQEFHVGDTNRCFHEFQSNQRAAARCAASDCVQTLPMRSAAAADTNMRVIPASATRRTSLSRCNPDRSRFLNTVRFDGIEAILDDPGHTRGTSSYRRHSCRKFRWPRAHIPESFRRDSAEGQPRNDTSDISRSPFKSSTSSRVHRASVESPAQTQADLD